ncbi:MAG: lipocalin-like domain-containing protein [Anaerovorax sp.]
MSKSFRETLVGAWRLVEYSIEDKNKSGAKFYPLGKDATGFIMYTPDGYMSAQIMSPGRPVYANGHLHTGTVEEMSKAAKGYMAYSGQYEVDEKTNTLHHHMEVSMNPTWEGQMQERFVKLEGDVITITNSNNNAVLIWKRAEDHANK